MLKMYNDVELAPVSTKLEGSRGSHARVLVLKRRKKKHACRLQVIKKSRTFLLLILNLPDVETLKTHVLQLLMCRRKQSTPKVNNMLFTRFTSQ